jgi:hypothetical protein
VGAVVLAAGEYTVNAGTLEGEILTPPPADMAGQVWYRARTG